MPQARLFKSFAFLFLGSGGGKLRMKCCSFAVRLFVLLALEAAAQAATTTYAATNVGPYKSTDGGVTWQSLKVTVPNTLLQGVPDVVAIAVDPTNPANVYFLAAANRTTAFFKSTDAGQTWSAVLLTGISLSSGTLATYQVAIDPVVTSRLYIKADGKVLRSTDAGASWTDIPALAVLAGVGGVIGIATDPNTSGLLYATSSGGGISRSADFGDTWKTVKLVFGNAAPTLGHIFVDPVNSQRLYVARRFGQGCTNQSRVMIDCGLFSSLDAGQTWQIVPIAGTSNSVAFDRFTGDIYAGVDLPGVNTTIVKSSDQGVTWTPLIKNAGGADGPSISADPGAAGNVYSLGDLSGSGAVQKTTDGGATWKPLTVPPYCTGFVSLTCPAPGPPRVNGLAYVAPPPPAAVSVSTTFSAASLQPGPVAAESIVMSIGLHIATGTATGDIYQPPTALAGTTVNVTDSAGITRPAVLFSVSATQVTYQIPPGTAVGTATVTITAGDGVTGTVQVQVAAVSPGVYTLNAAGLVMATVLRVSGDQQSFEDVYQTDDSGAIIARPIDMGPDTDQLSLIISGTGFRAAGTGQVSVTINGVDAPVSSAGAQGTLVGVDQATVMIPRSLAGSGSVDLVLTAAGQTANTVRISFQ